MRRFALTVLFVLGILVFMPSVVCAGYPYRVGTFAIGAEGSEFQRAFINCTDAITTETLNYAPAWLSGWKYRKKITIDHTKIDSDLKNFPVLVKLTSSNFDFSKARSDGYDIRFTASDGTTLLKYERERHDSANQVAEYWVKIPSVSSSANTEFYIYYGNSSALDGADPTNVWDANFKAVYHFNGNYNGTTGEIKDSTANGNDGQACSSTQAPTEVDGKIGKGQEFNYLDKDTIHIPDSSDFDPGGAFTVEIWAKHFDSGEANCVAIPVHDTSDYKWAIYSNAVIANNWAPQFVVKTASGVTQTDRSAPPPIVAGKWYYIVGVYDRTLPSSRVKYYQNGVLEASADGYDEDVLAGDEGLHFGGRYNQGCNTTYTWDAFDGQLDEFRYSNVARSAAWIKASYHSGNDTLLTYGSEEKSTKVLLLKTDKTNYSLGDVVRLGIKLNYTKEYLPVYARFKLELEEPVGEPDVLFQTNLFPLLPGFNVTKILKFPIPQTFWIPEGEYAFKATLTDSLGREIDSDVARFYVNDTLKVHYLEFDAV